MFFSALASALCLGVACGQEKGFDRESFANPDSVYSPGFFWMWNAKLDVAQLKAQLETANKSYSAALETAQEYEETNKALRLKIEGLEAQLKELQPEEEQAEQDEQKEQNIEK